MSSFNFTRSLLYSRKHIVGPFNIHACNVERMLYQMLQTTEIALSSRHKLQDELNKAKPFEEIPKLPMIPFFGSVWIYFPLIGRYNKNKMHEADFIKLKTYGDIVRERYGKFDIVSCYHPDAMRVLVTHEGKFPARAEFSTIKAYREKRKSWYQPLGLVAMQGREWKDFRLKVGRHVFNPFITKHYLNPLQDVAKDFVKLVDLKKDSKKEVHIMDLLYKWSLESIASIALDTRLDCLNPNLSPDSDGMKMIHSVHTQLACITKLETSSGNFPFWKYFPTPTWQRFTKAADTFTSLAFKYIKRTRDDCLKNREGKKEFTILQNMLMDKNMDVSAAMVAVADIIMAGIDTSSHAAGFVLYNLAKNPDKQELAYKEIMQKLPRKEDKLDDEVKLQYLNWCVKEALRLYPVVRGNLRIFDHDVVVNGYRIPAGIAVLCVHQVSSRDERFFTNPNEFIPERWSDPESITPYSYVPFGYGKRSCLGQFLAEMEIICLVTEILRNFSVEYHYEDIGMLTRLINIPDRQITLRFLNR